MSNLKIRSDDGWVADRVKLDNYFIDVSYNRAGARQSIVLVHGLGVSGDYFMKFAAEMDKYYNVYIINLPGYGKTPKPGRVLNVLELGEILASFIKAYKLIRPIIIGQSMGCQIAVKTAQQHQDLCGKLVLIGPTAYDRERSMIMQFWRLLQDSLREPVRLNLMIVRDYFRMGILRYLRTSCYMLSDRIEDSLISCNIPILIGRGLDDKIVPDNWIRRLAAITPSAKYVAISNSPHVVHYNNAKELTDACRSFING